MTSSLYYCRDQLLTLSTCFVTNELKTLKPFTVSSRNLNNDWLSLLFNRKKNSKRSMLLTLKIMRWLKNWKRSHSSIIKWRKKWKWALLVVKNLVKGAKACSALWITRKLGTLWENTGLQLIPIWNSPLVNSCWNRTSSALRKIPKISHHHCIIQGTWST